MPHVLTSLVEISVNSFFPLVRFSGSCPLTRLTPHKYAPLWLVVILLVWRPCTLSLLLRVSIRLVFVGLCVLMDTKVSLLQVLVHSS